jgi:thioredoxin-related protein
MAALAVSAAAQNPAPESAEALLYKAMKTAKAQKKTIFVKFEATWCGWCHKLTAALKDPEFGKVFNKHFVVVTLDVMERGEKEALENPGAEKFLAELGGEKSGLPYYAFLDAKGKKLADSNVLPPKNSNIGYPAAPEEIAAFTGLLKKTAHAITAAEVDKLTDWLKSKK